MSNKEDLLRKINLLASQGVYGEKTNAEAMLKKLMKKYNITSAELADDIVSFTKIQFKRGYMQKELLVQLIATSIPTLKRKYHFQKNNCFVELTKSEEIQIRAKYDFYSKRFADGLGIYFSAFVQKNKLFFNGPAEETKDIEQPCDEKLEQIFKMMNSLEQHQFRKQLTTEVK